MKTKLHPFLSFLIFCSGVETKFLKQAHSEHTKYASIGASVLFTAIFAFIASSYAIYKVFYIDSNARTVGGNVQLNVQLNEMAIYYALGFGFLWGLMIFNLDRYIVSSMRKEEKRWKEFVPAFLRIIVASLIAIVISKPLEVKLFETRILDQLDSKKQSVLKDKTEAELKQRNFHVEKKSKLDSMFLALQAAELERPIGVRNLQNDLAICLRNLERLENEYQKTRLELVKLDSTKYHEISSTQKQISELQSQINTARRECGIKKRNLKEAEDAYIKSIKSQKDEVTEQRDAEQKRVVRADSVFKAREQEVKDINDISFSPTLIPQLEALDSLKKAEREKGNYTVFLVGLFIILLFFAIETTPIFVKLLSSQGPYDSIFIKENKKEERIAEYRINFEETTSQHYYNRAGDERIRFIDQLFNNIIPLHEKKIGELIKKLEETDLSDSVFRNVLWDEFFKDMLEETDGQEEPTDNKPVNKNETKNPFLGFIGKNKIKLIVFIVILICTAVVYVSKNGDITHTTFWFAIFSLFQMFAQKGDVVIFLKKMKSGKKATSKIDHEQQIDQEHQN
ncbi:MAG: DUF4407 domain-containing protein [candidate division KSB1 bacterium]|nr:DUF4407 domain-containing protein [candidate division KSB1 bacterium]